MYIGTLPSERKEIHTWKKGTISFIFSLPSYVLCFFLWVFCLGFVVGCGVFFFGGGGRYESWFCSFVWFWVVGGFFYLIVHLPQVSFFVCNTVRAM